MQNPRANQHDILSLLCPALACIAGLCITGLCITGLSACASTGPPVSDPAEVLVRLEPAPSAICPGGGVEARSGLDADGDAILGDAEVSVRTWACDDTPVLLTSEPAGAADCVAGGTRIATGLDRDGDGRLAADEQHAETTVCNDAGDTLARARREGPSEACAIGAFVVEVGTDRSGDGVLQDAEVSRDERLCFFEVRSRIVDASVDECIAGGVRVESGADLDGDGTLDSGEVSTTSLACGDTLDASIVVGTAEDVARLSELRHILGSLRIVVAVDHLEVALAELRTVGAVEIYCGAAAPGCSVSLAAPALREISNTFSAGGVELRALSAPSLRRVGSLRFGSVSGLTSLTLPSLESADVVSIVSTDLATLSLVGFWKPPVETRIDNNRALTSLELRASAPSNPGSPPSTWMRGNASLERVRLRYHEEASLRDLDLTDNTALAELRIEGARRIGRLEVWRSPSLERLELGERATPLRVTQLDVWATLIDLTSVDVGEELWLVESQLTRVEVGAVHLLKLDGNPNLVSAHATEVTGFIIARDNPVLESITVDAPVLGLEGINLTDNARLRDALWLGELGRVSSTLEVGRNPALVLPERWDLVIDGDGVFPAQVLLEGRSVRELRLRTERLGLLRLVRTSLESVVAGSSRLDGSPTVEVVGNPDLQALSIGGDFPSMRTLRIEGNAVLSEVDLAAPDHAVSVSIVDNPRLPACFAADLLARTEAEDHEVQSGNDPTATCL